MLKFDSKIEAVLDQYHKRIEAETALQKSLPMAEGMKRRDEFLLSVGLETAVFLNTLAKSAQSKVILEVGTSYGYSTIWLAEAARANGGKVITLENNPQKADYARQQIEKAGLSDFVDFKIGDALDSITQITEGVDFVLLDIWKELYVPCFNLFFSLVRVQCIFQDSNAWEESKKKQKTKKNKKKQMLIDFLFCLFSILQLVELMYMKISMMN